MFFEGRASTPVFLASEAQLESQLEMKNIFEKVLISGLTT